MDEWMDGWMERQLLCGRVDGARVVCKHDVGWTETHLFGGMVICKQSEGERTAQYCGRRVGAGPHWSSESAVGCVSGLRSVKLWRFVDRAAPCATTALCHGT